MQGVGRTSGSAKAESFQAPSFLTFSEWQTLTSFMRLSPRQTAIAVLLLSGQTEEEIAETIGVSKHTVHSHLERLYRLHVRSRSDLIASIFEIYVEVCRRE